YGAEERGDVAHDPHQEFTGKNILYHARTLEETAARYGREVEDVRKAISEAARTLFEVRSRRVRPHLDDKILTGWNGLMISAFALGGAVLREPAYVEAARRAAEFVVARMYNPESGILLRRYREGDAAIPGFLDDYALFTQALLDLYETQFDRRHLDLAIRLAEKQRELFEDEQQGGFFSSAESDASLVLRVKEDYDGAEPSGNSITALNLLRLAQIAGRADFRQSAERLFAAFGSRLSTVPMAIPQMLVAYECLLSEPRQVVIAGAKGASDTGKLLETVFSHFLPNHAVLLLDSEETRQALAVGAPALAAMKPMDGRATAYVCRNYACQLPVSDADRLAELLQ
ncbi:MAG: thioredoxin domain-containing protein, partial [Acidobacteriia bacterium]|nr:thioredoxin domain-containing protein [Terriglobia bacterium]MBV8903793.1 thioredoxin domain-containing protein [Terriglobia bacterium]